MDIKKNYDRVLLIVAGVITIACGALLMMKSFAIGEKFPDVPEGFGKKMPEDNSAALATALAHVDKDVNWNYKNATDSKRIFRGFASVPIVKKADDPKEYDLFDSDSQIRPPMDNDYLLQYRLPFERDDVLERDEDNDGFSNLEEFKDGRTNPRDGEDYPDPTKKLQIAEITAKDYFLELSGVADEFTIKRHPVDDRNERWTIYTALDTAFPVDKGPLEDRGRYTLLSTAKEDVMNERTKRLQKNVETVMVKDSVVGDTFKLVKRVKLNRPVYKVIFRFDVPGASVPATEFAKGDKFTLGKTGIEVEVMEITAESATINYAAPGENPKTRKIDK